ncbi:MAG TPA: GerMN domain-containing protein [Fimbriimonas sp.]|nr:GerMN domain-containing protein [Fimbriimonas sp.]
MAGRKSSKSNSPGSKAVAVTMVAALIGVAAFAAYVQFTPGARNVADDMRRDQVSRPAPSVKTNVSPSEKPTDATAYLLPAFEGTEVKLATPASQTPEGVDPKVHLVSETFKVLGAPEARALKVEIKDKLAIVDVNSGLMEHGFGSMEEGQLIKALQLVLGQFPEVESFQLMSDGNPVELGHLDLSEPTPVVHKA